MIKEAQRTDCSMHGSTSTAAPLPDNRDGLIRPREVHRALSEIAVVRVELVGPDVRAQRVAHPGKLLRGVGLGLRGRTGPESRLLELLGDVVQVQVEVVGDEGADFGVLVVADEGPGVLCGGGVDVDVDGWIEKSRG